MDVKRCLNIRGYIKDGPDKGTYNYKNALPLTNMPRHYTYDVNPFKADPPEGLDTNTYKLYNKCLYGNSRFWKY